MNDDMGQIVLIILAAIGGLSGLLVVMTKLEPAEARRPAPSQRSAPARRL